MWVDAIGFLAAFITTVSFVPQAVKAWKTKHTKDISLGMLILLTTGVLFWLVYGVLTRDAPLILANIVTFALDVFILTLKVRYG